MQSQLSETINVSKPLMQLMKCGVCDHAVTGEAKRKASGKIYVYYHCAYRYCQQRRINTEQQELLRQFAAAFEPFARFTAEATAVFLNTIRDRVKNLSLYLVNEVNKLRTKQAKLQQRLQEVETLQHKGLLSPEELESIRELKDREIKEAEIEIGAHIKADRKTIEVGLNIIELIKNARDFIRLEGFELEKARLLKAMLSNPWS